MHTPAHVSLPSRHCRLGHQPIKQDPTLCTLPARCSVPVHRSLVLSVHLNNCPLLTANTEDHQTGSIEQHSLANSCTSRLRYRRPAMRTAHPKYALTADATTIPLDPHQRRVSTCSNQPAPQISIFPIRPAFSSFCKPLQHN